MFQGSSHLTIKSPNKDNQVLVKFMFSKFQLTCDDFLFDQDASIASNNSNITEVNGIIDIPEIAIT
jgi:hypothetical protein